MSEPAAESTAAGTTDEGAEDKEAIDYSPQGDSAFGALMDALAPEEAGAQGGEAGTSGQTSADGAGDSAPEGEAKPEGEGSAAADAGGDAGKPAVEGDGEQPAATSDSDTGGDESDGGGRPAEWTTPASELTPKFGELSTKLEESVAKAYHEEALDEVREEHKRYFEELEKHPRQLIGMEVPSVTGEGNEVLRDAEDAKQWQDAVKQILVDEVRDRASRSLEENQDFLETIHSSIELFQNNHDLIPGTKEFDRQLADKFATMMKDYELRDDEDKLLGYSVPVQPIINSLRTDLAAARAAKPEPAAPASEEKPKGQEQQAAPPKPEDQPQAGIQSKAGNSSEEEDFSTLFGTIGLPNLRI